MILVGLNNDDPNFVQGKKEYSILMKGTHFPPGKFPSKIID